MAACNFFGWFFAEECLKKKAAQSAMSAVRLGIVDENESWRGALIWLGSLRWAIALSRY